MECDDIRLLQRWAVHWREVVEFEFISVVSGKETPEGLMPLIED